MAYYWCALENVVLRCTGCFVLLVFLIVFFGVFETVVVSICSGVSKLLWKKKLRWFEFNMYIFFLRELIDVSCS